jgi:hypothetical protein
MAWKEKYGPLLVKVAVAVFAAILSALATWLGVPPEVVERVVEVERESGEYARTFGWERDADAIAENLDPARTVQFAATPAGRAVLAGDSDVYLWQAVRKAAGKGPEWYPNVNQGAVGSCVGAGNKHGVDALQGVQIARGANLTWKPVSAEVIYAGSRVEVGGGRIRGDGSVGSWAAKWVKDYGVVPMEVVGAHDLSRYSESRARSWGRTGVPDDLEPVARQHPVKGVAVVTSWPDVDRAVRQGYPVVVCSDQGFAMDRDRDGFCDPEGRWAHCMCFLGVRGGARQGAFCLNSWGDRAHTGPTYPADAPPAGFWVDARTVDRMVRQGESFAYSDAAGFPGRKLPDDWFIRRPPGRPRDPFALLERDWRLSP